MLDSRPTRSNELPYLEALLSANKLCFNDLESRGVELFSVSRDNKMVGYFGYEIFGEDALFRSFIVVPEERNKNYGHQMWEMAKGHLKNRKVKHVYLLTNTATDFFAKVGYTLFERAHVPVSIAQTSEFVTFCPTDSVCMRYEIN
ncbi:MAG: GNAT family N-acetyltransferase [Cyclobacteriaceae bacterium]|nr:GNAT family N-acetyltransferase [Cyclobacteriaceae bacterium]